jgi:uncharacterized protein (UPF0261 family)
MTALLVATLDTKGEEAGFVRDCLRRCGVECLVLDAGSMGPARIEADIPRAEVFAGFTPDGDRGRAVEAASRGAAAAARRLFVEGRIRGVIGIGGSAGTAIGTAAMRELPVGVPKVMVSTLASGQVRPYVGVRDVCMMYSVVDISGLNRVSRAVLANAAHAMAGMLLHSAPATAERPVITATMFGVTTPCVEAARAELEAGGYEVLVFHATGTGGMTMESLIADGAVRGVLDATTTELADELVGGILSAGPDRLTAASKRGVPQVIGLGALDMVNFGPEGTVPEMFRGRRFHRHNQAVTLMRTTPEENVVLGRWVAERASMSGGPVEIHVPLRGVSALDREGQPFWWPETDAALFDAVRRHAGANVRVVEVDAHINDAAFATGMAKALLAMLRA